MNHVEYANGTAANMEAYRSLAKAADMPVSVVVGLAEENRLHVAAKRAEVRSQRRRDALALNRTRQMAAITKGKRYGRTTTTPDASEHR